MANKILNTRIQIRNDTAENWSRKNPVLLKGEFGVELGASPAQNKIKIGDGTTAWNDLGYTFDLVAIIAQIPHGGEVSQLTKNNLEESDDTVLATVSDPENGDVAVITTTVEDVEYEKSAYIYNGSAWVALNGRVDADKVILRGEVTLAGNYENVGNISKGSASATGSYDWNAQSVQGFLTNMLTKVQQPTITKQPSCSISLSGAGAKEVGTEFTPSYSVSFDPGSYTAFSGQVATGVTVTSYAVTDTNSGSASTQTGSFTQFTVGDDTNYHCSVTVQHTAGATAKDNMGKESNPPVAIQAGSKSAQSATVTGYRNEFYGTMTTKPASMSSGDIRGLSGKKAVANGNISVSVPVGALRVVIAVPNTKVVNSVLDVNGLNAQIFSSFTHTTVDVEGANSYTAKTYNVYYLDYANANDTANTYTVTIANA